MAGVFTAAAILLIIIGIVIHIAWMRRRQRWRNKTTQRRISSPSAFSYVEPSPVRPSPSLRLSSFGRIGSRWWNSQKRRSGNSQGSAPSPLHSGQRDHYTEKSESIIGSEELMVYRPPGKDSELGHIYGRVRGIQCLPRPEPLKYAPQQRSANHGRLFTLEDALLPSLASTSYHVYSAGRHPYAQ